METINSNVNGVLEHFAQNEDKTFKVKILGEDGLFHIYDNLSRAVKSDTYNVGDYIGESKELHYEVRGHYLGGLKESDTENNLDFDAMVKFIQSRLEQDEIAMPQEMIELILDLEMEYMIENGFAETVMNND